MLSAVLEHVKVVSSTCNNLRRRGQGQKIFQFMHKLEVPQAKVCNNRAQEFLNESQVPLKISKLVTGIFEIPINDVGMVFNKRGEIVIATLLGCIFRSQCLNLGFLLNVAF